MLQAIFYARFHPVRGPSIIHQYPPTSILPPPSSATPPLIDWSSISAYVIPPYDLCNRSFSILSGSHRVLGFPISLEDPEYDRNRFTFNICFIIDEKENTQPWEQIVRKTGKFFESIEKDDCVLQIEEDLKGLKLAGEEGYPEKEVGTVAYLLERIWEDLNGFGECCVQLPGWGMTTLNLRYDEPEEREGKKGKLKVRVWDVPVLIRALPKREEWTWDLTLERVGQWVDGIRCVGRIAEVADVEVKLVKRCVRELVLLRRAVVLDVFHFGAIYTCTKDVVGFGRDEEAQTECREYVAVPKETEGEDKSALPTKDNLIMLYTALQPGTPLRDFCLEHEHALQNIDIRRFITFGVLKGFLRRIHKYALALENTTAPLLPGEKKRSGSSRISGDDAVREMDRAYRRAALSSGWATPPLSITQSGSLGQLRRSEGELMHDRIMFYLDGGQPLDRACVEMGISEKGFLERVRHGKFGEVVLFNK